MISRPGDKNKTYHCSKIIPTLSVLFFTHPLEMESDFEIQSEAETDIIDEDQRWQLCATMMSWVGQLVELVVY